MRRAYVVTEGPTDKEILERILPEDVREDVEIVDASGSYGARSLARSILLARERPVALVVDADTTNEDAVQELKEMLQEYLGVVSKRVPYEVFLAVPEIEALLVEERALTHMIGRQVSDVERELAKARPKKFLQMNRMSTSAVLESIDDSSIDAFRGHPVIVGLTKFLSSVKNDGK